MTNKMEKRYSFSPLYKEYRAQISGESNSRRIKGYGIVFNQRSKIITEWVPEKQELRSFYESIDPQALDNILNNGFDVVMDVNHSFNEILARTASGTLTLTKDNVGITYEFDAPLTQRGEDVLQMVKRGDYYESSFAFIVAEDEWLFDKESGLYLRLIKKIETLYDMAVCSYRGAYNNTSIMMCEPTMMDSSTMMDTDMNSMMDSSTMKEPDMMKNQERVFEYNKSDLEVAARKLNELYANNPVTVKENKKYNDDFVTRIYLKRSWERKKTLSRNS